MAAIQWIETALGFVLCGFGLYLLVARRPEPQLNLEAGGLKLTVANAGAFLLILGVALMALARISSVAWKDLEIQLGQARADREALTVTCQNLRQELNASREQLRSLSTSLDQGGLARYEVPDLVGLQHDRAVALIRRSNLDTLGIQWLDSGRAGQALAEQGYRLVSEGVLVKGDDTLRLAPGEVIGQAVMPGARLPRDSKVMLTAVERK